MERSLRIIDQALCVIKRTCSCRATRREAAAVMSAAGGKAAARAEALRIVSAEDEDSRPAGRRSTALDRSDAATSRNVRPPAQMPDPHGSGDVTARSGADDRRTAARRGRNRHLMAGTPEPTYGQSTAWQPERPRWRLFPLVVSWLATGVALMVAAGILPGVEHRGLLGRARRRGDRGGAERGHPAGARRAAVAAHARARLPARAGRGRAHPPDRRRPT